MVAEGYLIEVKCWQISVKFPVSVYRLYEHRLYLWDYYYVLEIGKYKQK